MAAIAQPWLDFSPLAPEARLWKAGRPRKVMQNARPVHPSGMQCVCDPDPWGPAPLRLAAVILGSRKSKMAGGQAPKG